MTTENMYVCTPRQTKKYIIRCLEAKLVPFIQSSPGIGKSSIVKQIAKEYNLKLIDHRLSTSAPEDLTGLPRFTEDGLAKFAPFADLFPLKGMELPKGKKGWLLFLDEFNSAPRSVQAAAYKLILDRMIGQYKLHPKVFIVAAGNLMSDKAITNTLSTAMQSRLIHIFMEPNFQEWLQDVALPKEFDSRIIAFLNRYPNKLMDFRPDHEERTFCCPRTWEFTNKLIKNKNIEDGDVSLLSGAITSGVAVEFVQFSKIYKDLITIEDIVKDPENAPIPEDLSIKWATISHILEKVNEKNLPEILKYVTRFTLDFKLLFFRGSLIRYPIFTNIPEFQKEISHVAKYIYD